MSSGTVFKVFLVSSEGGSPEELIPGDKDNEDDPQWSPDGSSLLFAQYPQFGGGDPNKYSKLISAPGSCPLFLEARECGHRVCRRMGESSAPSPWTRTSDFTAGSWSELTTGKSLQYPNFRTVFTDIFEIDEFCLPSIKLDRVNLTDRKRERVLGVKDIPRVFMTESGNPGMALTLTARRSSCGTLVSRKFTRSIWSSHDRQ